MQQSGDEDVEQLSQDKLMLLASCEPMVEYLSACDHLLYQCIVDFLIPEVLSPIPGTLTQAIRNFAKSLESWLTNTIQGYPQNLVKTKVGAFYEMNHTSNTHIVTCCTICGTHPTGSLIPRPPMCIILPATKSLGTRRLYGRKILKSIIEQFEHCCKSKAPFIQSGCCYGH